MAFHETMNYEVSHRFAEANSYIANPYIYRPTGITAENIQDFLSCNSTTSTNITIDTGTGSYGLAETINELKDEIQVLKDEMNNLRMLLLEN